MEAEETGRMAGLASLPVAGRLAGAQLIQFEAGTPESAGFFEEAGSGGKIVVMEGAIDIAVDLGEGKGELRGGIWIEGGAEEGEGMFDGLFILGDGGLAGEVVDLEEAFGSGLGRIGGGGLVGIARHDRVLLGEVAEPAGGGGGVLEGSEFLRGLIGLGGECGGGGKEAVGESGGATAEEGGGPAAGGGVAGTKITGRIITEQAGITGTGKDGKGAGSIQ